jgi:hypothetical protein
MSAQIFVKLGILIVTCVLPVASSAQQTQTSCDTTREHTLYSWKAAIFADALMSPDRKKVLAMKRLPPADDDEGSIRYTVAVDGRQFSTQRSTEAYMRKAVRFNGTNGFGLIAQSLEGKLGEVSFFPLDFTKRPVYEPTMVRACDALGFGCNHGYSGIGPVRLRFPFDSLSARGHWAQVANPACLGRGMTPVRCELPCDPNECS